MLTDKDLKDLMLKIYKDLGLQNKNLSVFDFETRSIGSGNYPKPIQLGAATLSGNDLRLLQKYITQKDDYDPETDKFMKNGVQKSIAELTGIAKKHLSSPEFKNQQITEKELKALGLNKDVLMGYNAEFDLGVLKKVMGGGWKNMNILDVQTVVLDILGKKMFESKTLKAIPKYNQSNKFYYKGYSLQEVAKFLEINDSQEHSGLSDVRMTMEVLNKTLAAAEKMGIKVDLKKYLNKIYTNPGFRKNAKALDEQNRPMRGLKYYSFGSSSGKAYVRNPGFLLKAAASATKTVAAEKNKIQKVVEQKIEKTIKTLEEKKGGAPMTVRELDVLSLRMSQLQARLKSLSKGDLMVAKNRPEIDQILKELEPLQKQLLEARAMAAPISSADKNSYEYFKKTQERMIADLKRVGATNYLKGAKGVSSFDFNKYQHLYKSGGDIGVSATQLEGDAYVKSLIFRGIARAAQGVGERRGLVAPQKIDTNITLQILEDINRQKFEWGKSSARKTGDVFSPRVRDTDLYNKNQKEVAMAFGAYRIATGMAELGTQVHEVFQDIENGVLRKTIDKKYANYVEKNGSVSFDDFLKKTMGTSYGQFGALVKERYDLAVSKGHSFSRTAKDVFNEKTGLKLSQYPELAAILDSDIAEQAKLGTKGKLDKQKAYFAKTVLSQIDAMGQLGYAPWQFGITELRMLGKLLSGDLVGATADLVMLNLGKLQSSIPKTAVLDHKSSHDIHPAQGLQLSLTSRLFDKVYGEGKLGPLAAIINHPRNTMVPSVAPVNPSTNYEIDEDLLTQAFEKANAARKFFKASLGGGTTEKDIANFMKRVHIGETRGVLRNKQTGMLEWMEPGIGATYTNPEGGQSSVYLKSLLEDIGGMGESPRDIAYDALKEKISFYMSGPGKLSSLFSKPESDDSAKAVKEINLNAKRMAKLNRYFPAPLQLPHKESELHDAFDKPKEVAPFPFPDQSDKFPRNSYWRYFTPQGIEYGKKQEEAARKIEEKIKASQAPTSFFDANAAKNIGTTPAINAVFEEEKVGANERELAAEISARKKEVDRHLQDAADRLANGSAGFDHPDRAPRSEKEQAFYSWLGRNLLPYTEYGEELVPNSERVMAGARILGQALIPGVDNGTSPEPSSNFLHLINRRGHPGSEFLPGEAEDFHDTEPLPSQEAWMQNAEEEAAKEEERKQKRLVKIEKNFSNQLSRLYGIKMEKSGDGYSYSYDPSLITETAAPSHIFTTLAQQKDELDTVAPISGDFDAANQHKMLTNLIPFLESSKIREFNSAASVLREQYDAESTAPSELGNRLANVLTVYEMAEVMGRLGIDSTDEQKLEQIKSLKAMQAYSKGGLEEAVKAVPNIPPAMENTTDSLINGGIDKNHLFRNGVPEEDQDFEGEFFKLVNPFPGKGENVGGELLSIKEGDFDGSPEAFAALNEAMDISPKNADLFKGLPDIGKEMKDYLLKKPRKVIQNTLRYGYGFSGFLGGKEEKESELARLHDFNKTMLSHYREWSPSALGMMALKKKQPAYYTDYDFEQLKSLNTDNPEALESIDALEKEVRKYRESTPPSVLSFNEPRLPLGKKAKRRRLEQVLAWMNGESIISAPKSKRSPKTGKEKIVSSLTTEALEEINKEAETDAAKGIISSTAEAAENAVAPAGDLAAGGSGGGGNGGKPPAEKEMKEMKETVEDTEKKVRKTVYSLSDKAWRNAEEEIEQLAANQIETYKDPAYRSTIADTFAKGPMIGRYGKKIGVNKFLDRLYGSFVPTETDRTFAEYAAPFGENIVAETIQRNGAGSPSKVSSDFSRLYRAMLTEKNMGKYQFYQGLFNQKVQEAGLSPSQIAGIQSDAEQKSLIGNPFYDLETKQGRYASAVSSGKRDWISLAKKDLLTAGGTKQFINRTNAQDALEKYVQSVVDLKTATESFLNDSSEKIEKAKNKIAAQKEKAKARLDKAIGMLPIEEQGVLAAAAGKAEQANRPFSAEDKRIVDLFKSQYALKLQNRLSGALIQKKIQYATGAEKRELEDQYQMIAQNEQFLGISGMENGRVTAIDPVTGKPVTSGELSEKEIQKLSDFKFGKDVEYGRKSTEIAGKHFNPGSIIGKVFDGLKTAIARAIEYGAAYAMIAKFKQMVQLVVETTKQLDKIATNIQIVTGKSDEQVQGLLTDYSKLAGILGRTTAEVATSANEFLRMGYTGEDAMEMITQAMTLSTLGMIDASEAAKYLTAAVKGYGVQVEDVSTIVDMATALDMKYATSAGEILQAMSRTAASAKLAKVNMSNLQAMITVTMETSQKSAESIGEAFKTAFARFGNVKAGKVSFTALTDETEGINDIEKALAKLGIQIRDNNAQWKSYQDVIDEIGTKWKTWGDVEKNLVTTAMFGTRQREVGNILLENYDTYREAVNVAETSEGTAAQKLLDYTDSLEASTKRLTTAWENFTQSTKLTGVLKVFNNVLSSIVKNLSGILIAFSAFSLLKYGPMIASKALPKFAGLGGIGGGLLSSIKAGTGAWTNIGGSVRKEFANNALDRVEEKSLTGTLQTFRIRVDDATTAISTWTAAVNNSSNEMGATVPQGGASIRETQLGIMSGSLRSAQMAGETDKEYALRLHAYQANLPGYLHALNTKDTQTATMLESGIDPEVKKALSGMSTKDIQNLEQAQKLQKQQQYNALRGGITTVGTIAAAMGGASLGGKIASNLGGDKTTGQTVGGLAGGLLSSLAASIPGVWGAIASVVIGLVTTLFSVITNDWNQVLSDMANALADVKELFSNIDDFSSSIKEQKDKLDKGLLTEEEAETAREDLLDIQKQLVEKYGSLADSLDLIGNSYEDIYDQLLSIASSELSTWWEDNASVIKKYEKALKRGTAEGADVYSEYKETLKYYGGAKLLKENPDNYKELMQIQDQLEAAISSNNQALIDAAVSDITIYRQKMAEFYEDDFYGEAISDFVDKQLSAGTTLIKKNTLAFRVQNWQNLRDAAEALSGINENATQAEIGAAGLTDQFELLRTAAEATGLKVEDLMDVLVDLGYIAPDLANELSGTVYNRIKVLSEGKYASGTWQAKELAQLNEEFDIFLKNLGITKEQFEELSDLFGKIDMNGVLNASMTEVQTYLKSYRDAVDQIRNGLMNVDTFDTLAEQFPDLITKATGNMAEFKEYISSIAKLEEVYYKTSIKNTLLNSKEYAAAFAGENGLSYFFDTSGNLISSLSQFYEGYNDLIDIYKKNGTITRADIVSSAGLQSDGLWDEAALTEFYLKFASTDYQQEFGSSVSAMVNWLNEYSDSLTEFGDTFTEVEEKIAADVQALYDKTAIATVAEDQLQDYKDAYSYIEYTIDKQIKKLQTVNEEREKTIKLMELEEALSKAKENKVKVYREGQGFVYEEDVQAVEEAQKSLQEYLDSQNIQNQIDQLNDYKDAWGDALKAAEMGPMKEALESILDSDFKGSSLQQGLAALGETIDGIAAKAARLVGILNGSIDLDEAAISELTGGNVTSVQTFVPTAEKMASVTAALSAGNGSQTQSDYLNNATSLYNSLLTKKSSGIALTDTEKSQFEMLQSYAPAMKSYSSNYNQDVIDRYSAYLANVEASKKTPAYWGIGKAVSNPAVMKHGHAYFSGLQFYANSHYLSNVEGGSASLSSLAGIFEEGKIYKNPVDGSYFGVSGGKIYDVSSWWNSDFGMFGMQRGLDENYDLYFDNYSEAIKSYARGTKKTNYNQLALVGEEGPELRVLPGGAGVLPAKTTSNLWELGKDPGRYISRYLTSEKLESNQMSGNSQYENYTMNGVVVYADDADAFVTSITQKFKPLAQKSGYKK